MEVNFGVSNNVENQKKKLLKLIGQIDARMISRFGKGTYLPTINIIASSKDTEQSFLDSYINTKRQNESRTTLIVDEPQWVVRNDKGSPEDPGSFYVAVGNKFLPHELLPVTADDNLIENYRAKGYSMLRVPPIYREHFETNLDQALMDDAGISSASTTKFLSGARLNQAKVSTYKNLFLKDVIEVGDDPEDFTQYANYFDLSAVSPGDLEKPLFIHLDMSTGGKGKGDKTGISGVWITGKQPSIPGQEESLSLRFKLAFSVSIKAPKGRYISFEKNVNFIKWLRAQGFAVKLISADTYQSAAVLQELTAAGFKTQVLSVDRTNSDKICLTGETLVSTPTGQVKLKDITAGQEVWSYNINEGCAERDQVSIWSETAKVSQLIKIHTAKGVIECTEDHPILTTRGYVEAGKLAKADRIICLHNIKLAGKTARNKGKKLSNEHVEHMREAQLNRTAQQIIDSKLKEHNTCEIKGSYKKHKTKAELKVEQVLLEFFQPSDICYQYFEPDRYPFACDYYLRPLDLFIEVNVYPAHGGKPFENSQEDLLKVVEWDKKANIENKKQYANWIYTWTDLDCRKLACARRNSLQYLMIYDLNNLYLLRQVILAKLAKLDSIQIDKIEKITYEVPVPVYDITVTKNNNFIVADGLVVHNCEPYQYLRSAIYDRRVQIYQKCDLLTEELVNLERESSGKINHPDGGKYGSKDQADAFCGALYMASKFAEEYAFDYGETIDTFFEVNEEVTDQHKRAQFILDFQTELQNIYFEQQNVAKIQNKQELEERQYYQDVSDGIIVI